MVMTMIIVMIVMMMTLVVATMMIFKVQARYLGQYVSRFCFSMLWREKRLGTGTEIRTHCSLSL